MITKVSIFKFLLHTWLQKEVFPISLTASVFPYWIIYNYIYIYRVIYIYNYIYTHTYTCCYVSDLHGRTEQLINSKKLCWPYYIPFPLFLLLLFPQYSLKKLYYLKILFFHSLLNLFQSSFCHFHFTKIPLFKIICVSHIAKLSCLLAVFILPHVSATLSQFITLSFETLFFFFLLPDNTSQLCDFVPSMSNCSFSVSFCCC